MTAGQRADCSPTFFIDSDRDEFREMRPGAVEHAERSVTGVDEVGRDFGDALQRLADVEFGTDSENSIDQPTKLERSRFSSHGRERILAPQIRATGDSGAGSSNSDALPLSCCCFGAPTGLTSGRR